ELANNVAQRLGIDSALLRQELRHAATNRSAQFNPGTQAEVSDAEKVIVRLLAPGAPNELDELRAQVSDVLLNESLTGGLAAASIIDSLLSPLAGGATPESDQRLLASILMQETEELSFELVESAIEALRRRKLEGRKRALNANIAEAERKNDAAALSALLAEKVAIERALRA
ncbi:MAG: hypothetical protein JOZ10_05065, partial [Acidobacteria bacterium]|nr:hypothetical protein [Acidobacteriota bacterium]